MHPCFTLCDGDQVERIEVREGHGIEIGIATRAGQEILQQVAARGAAAVGRSMVGEIGHSGKAALFGDSEPGTAGPDIASRQQMRVLRPAPQWLCWAGVHLVPVADRDQLPVGMSLPGERDDTHPARHSKSRGLCETIVRPCRALRAQGRAKTGSIIWV